MGEKRNQADKKHKKAKENITQSIKNPKKYK